MKALLKSSLLLALIIGGKLAKQAPPATVAVRPVPKPHNVVLVHQVLTSEPVPATVAYYSYYRKPKPDTLSAF